MTGQTYDTFAGRTEKYKGRILAKAMFREKLTKLGSVEPMPQNKSENIEWLRFLPYGGVDNQWLAAGGDTAFINAHILTEGVTPSADSISTVSATAALQQIGCLYSYTDKTRYVHEEGSEIPKEMEDQVAARISLCREMMAYGEMKTCTNKFYGGTGTSPTTVDGPPTKALFQKVSRALQAKHGGMITELLSSSANYGSQSVDAGWIAYCHTDMEATFENMVGFTKVADYGGKRTIDPDEIGSIGRFRIVTSPILTYIPDSGDPVANWTGSGTPKSTSGTLMDVYPIVVVGKGKDTVGGDAFGQVALRGQTALDAGHIPVGTKSAADPLGQRGYVSGQTWFTAAVLNDDWMAVLYVGTEAL